MVYPVTVLVKLHCTQLSLQSHACGVVVEPHAHEVILCVAQGGQRRQKVGRRSGAELSWSLSGLWRPHRRIKRCARHIDAPNRDHAGTSLNLQVHTQQLNLSQQPTESQVERVM